MRKLLVLFSLTFFFLGCDQQKISKLESEVTQLKEQNNLIRQQAQTKDEFVEEYATTLNEVYDNLERIRKREGLISKYSKDLENKDEKSVRDKMLDNIASIDDYIERSKNKLNTLRNRFKESEIGISALEETIVNLTQQLEEKEQYIDELKIQVADLNEKVSEALAAIEQRDLIIEEQIEQINLAYYVIGSDDELEEKEVITKKGGLLGIGKTTVLSPVMPENVFNQTDITLTNEIEISGNVDDIEIVSTHNPDSYKLVSEDETRTKLQIKKPDEFWKTRYLVIITKG